MASSQFPVLVLRRNSADSNRPAMGGDRGIHIVADNLLDPLTEATAIAKVLGEEKPDLVLLGKQSVDDDQGQVGVMLADVLTLHIQPLERREPRVRQREEEGSSTQVADGRLESVREVDGGLETVSAVFQQSYY